MKKYLAILIGCIILSCQKDDRKADVIVLTTKDVVNDNTTANGVEYSATILLDSYDPVIEFGFVYGMNHHPSLNDSEVLASIELSNTSFKMYPENPLVPDTTYYVRSFVRTKSHLVYGNEVEFYSNGCEAPVIESIEPAIAFWGDTIKLIGSNFDHSGNHNKIWFDGMPANKLWGSQDTIYAIVPSSINTKSSQVSVELYGKKSENTKKFEIYSPNITSISHTEGQYPDTVTVYGNYFSEQYGQLFLSDFSIVAESLQKDQVKFVVPFLGEGKECSIQFKQLNETISAKELYKYKSQSINAPTVSEVYLTDTITLSSSNIDFTKAKIETFIDGVKCNVISVTRDKLSVVPNYNYNNVTKTKFTFTCQATAAKSLPDELIHRSNLEHKLPVITGVSSNKLAYGSSIEAYVQGTYQNGLIYYQNLDEPEINGYIRNGSIHDNTHYTRLLREMIPGKYEIWINSFERSTNKVQIEIPVPLINSAECSLLRRNSEVSGTITGEYLPLMGDYMLRHVESGRSFYASKSSSSSYYGSINPNEFILYRTIGKGTYELFVNLNNSHYPTNITFEIDDYFTYHSKYENYDFIGYSSFAYTIDNKIYYRGRDEKGFVINISTGSKTELSTDFFPVNSFNTITVPIFFNNEVYSIMNGKLYKFDAANEKWAFDNLETPDAELTAGCVVNGQLQVFTNTGKSYIKDTQWNNGPDVPALNDNYPRFAAEHNGTIFLGNAYYFSALSTTTWEIEATYSTPFPPGNMFKIPQHIFTKGNYIYVCYETRGTYHSKFLRFSMESKSYEKPNPSYLPDDDYDYKFAPSKSGEVYMMNEEYIYDLGLN